MNSLSILVFIFLFCKVSSYCILPGNAGAYGTVFSTCTSAPTLSPTKQPSINPTPSPSTDLNMPVTSIGFILVPSNSSLHSSLISISQDFLSTSYFFDCSNSITHQPINCTHLSSPIASSYRPNHTVQNILNNFLDTGINILRSTPFNGSISSYALVYDYIYQLKNIFNHPNIKLIITMNNFETDI